MGKRRTTVAHAFASAIAPADVYDPERVAAAMAFLGQPPDGPLRCVYCDAPAETWDHLVGLVSGARFSGYGHVVGNLVPCCKPCNSAKGNRPWREFVAARSSDPAVRTARIEAYQRAFAAPGVPYEEIRERAPAEVASFERLQAEVLAKMEEADALAARIRSLVRSE